MVFAILGLGYYQEHVGRVDPMKEFVFPEEGAMHLEELHLPGGDESLSGRVLDSDGQPLPGVQISLRPLDPTPASAEPLHWTLSAEDGSYELHGLNSAKYIYSLYLAGFPIEEAAQPVHPPVEGHFDFHMGPAKPPVEAIPEVVRAGLLGSVRLPAGQLLKDHPLEGFEVIARPLSPNEAMTGAVTRRTKLDATGLFEFDDLVLGPYRLEVLPSWACGGSWPVLGSMDWTHATGEGAQDPFLELRSGSVTGVILDQDAQPVVDAVVMLWPAEQPGHTWPVATSDSAGRVEVGDLPAGEYVVRVRAGRAASEVQVFVQEGISSGLTLDALQLGPESPTD